MRSVVDAANLDLVRNNVDLVDAAGLLGEYPIRGKRKIHQLNEQRPVDAGVRDHHHGLTRMSVECQTQRIRRSQNHVLERFAAWESHQMRSRKPRGVKFWFGSLHLLVGLHLPVAVIDIVELSDALAFYAACAGNGRTCQDTSRKRTRVDYRRMPFLRYATSNRRSLRLSALSERQILPTAKAGRVDALDMAVAHQDDLGQLRALFGDRAGVTCARPNSSLRTLDCELGSHQISRDGVPL